MKTYSFSKLAVISYPSLLDLKNPYIFSNDTKAVINVSEHPYSRNIMDELNHRGIRVYHFPLIEESSDMGIDNIIKALKVLDQFDRKSTRILINCTGGNNRSRTVAEAFYYMKTGEHLADEYKGYINHLVFNCETGHLPHLCEMEHILSGVRFTDDDSDI